MFLDTAIRSSWRIRDSGLNYRVGFLLFRGPKCYEICFASKFVVVSGILGIIASNKCYRQALNLFMSALGNWATIPLVLLVNYVPKKPWLPENLDDGHLEYYFFILGALMTANMV